jgi:thiamine-phosphate pyrophosphorylase
LARRLKIPGLPPLILMTDADRLPDPVGAVAALPRGSAVIVRHRDGAALEALAGALAGPCRRHGIRLLVAGEARLAWAVGADGVHLPEVLARRGPIRRRPGWLVTAAAHSPAALARAAAAGADAALLSPVFTTASHSGTPPLGALLFAAWCRDSPLPVYALGGIDAGSARRLMAATPAGFAGIGGLAGP